VLVITFTSSTTDLFNAHEREAMVVFRRNDAVEGRRTRNGASAWWPATVQYVEQDRVTVLLLEDNYGQTLHRDLVRYSNHPPPRPPVAAPSAPAAPSALLMAGVTGMSPFILDHL
jgi:hypothetical protein